MKRKWTTEEENYIRNNFKEKSCKEMAIVLNRTTRAVQHKYSQLGLDRLPKIGDKINRLTIVEMYDIQYPTQLKTYAKCQCDCAKIICVRLSSIVQNHTKSCGCLKSEIQSKQAIKRNYKHGKGNFTSRIYRIWCAMRSRCNNPNTIGYHNYGGRGIKVENIWSEFPQFEQWALSHGYSDNLSLDRIDTNSNYYPENCRWADRKTQCRNRRNNRMDTVKITAFGETKSGHDWLNDNRCKITKLPTLLYRIGAGWQPEIAISKKSKRN